MVPAFGGQIPITDLTVVVLPMPLRPSSVTTSPFWMERLTLNSTWLRP
jgi:hypothetical protein